MSKQDNCKHEKVYANYILPSYPVQYPWICRKCGFKGMDRGQVHIDEYSLLLKEFEDKNDD